MNESKAASKRSKLIWILISVVISSIVGTILSMYVKRYFERDKPIPFHASVFYGIGSFVLPERKYDRLEVRLVNDGKRHIEDIDVKLSADYLQHVDPKRSRHCTYQGVKKVSNMGEHSWRCALIGPKECILLTLPYPVNKRRANWINVSVKSKDLNYSERIYFKDEGILWTGTACHQ